MNSYSQNHWFSAVERLRHVLRRSRQRLEVVLHQIAPTLHQRSVLLTHALHLGHVEAQLRVVLAVLQRGNLRSKVCHNCASKVRMVVTSLTRISSSRSRAACSVARMSRRLLRISLRRESSPLPFSMSCRSTSV